MAPAAVVYDDQRAVTGYGTKPNAFADDRPIHNYVAQDAAEKALMKVATRGVVRLFNAVSKAQKQSLEESIVGKRAKVSCCLGALQLKHALSCRTMSASRVASFLTMSMQY